MDSWHILCQWKKCLLSRGHNRESVFTNSSWRECLAKHSVSCVACLLSAVTSAVPSPWMFALTDICVNVIILYQNCSLSWVIIYLYCTYRVRQICVHWLTRSELKTWKFEIWKKIGKTDCFRKELFSYFDYRVDFYDKLLWFSGIFTWVLPYQACLAWK